MARGAVELRQLQGPLDGAGQLAGVGPLQQAEDLDVLPVCAGELGLEPAPQDAEADRQLPAP